jgi:hypothetical protein
LAVGFDEYGSTGISAPRANAGKNIVATSKTSVNHPCYFSVLTGKRAA